MFHPWLDEDVADLLDSKHNSIPFPDASLSCVSLTFPDTYNANYILDILMFYMSYVNAASPYDAALDRL
jgi:hypothetical protein